MLHTSRVESGKPAVADPMCSDQNGGLGEAEALLQAARRNWENEARLKGKLMKSKKVKLRKELRQKRPEAVKRLLGEFKVRSSTQRRRIIP